MKYILRINGVIHPCVTPLKPKQIPDYWSGRDQVNLYSKYELLETLERLLSERPNTDIFQIKMVKEGNDTR